MTPEELLVIWGGYAQVQALWWNQLIDQGLLISTKECVSVNNTSVADITFSGDGPYMLCAFGLDPDGGAQNSLLSVYVDGVLTHQANCFYVDPFTANEDFLVGLYFSQPTNCGPVIGTTSIRITASPASFCRYSLVKYEAN